MTRASLRFIFALAIATLANSAKAATTYYVGTCHAGSFATINAAANSPKVAAGSIIKICPGTYFEQVVVNRSLTIEGMTSGNGNLAWLTTPESGATVTSAISGTTLQPGIWVQAGTVTLFNLFITIGSNGQTNCPVAYPGVYFAGGTSGTVNHIYEYPQYSNTCAIGVWAENTSFTSVESSVTIENSWINTDYFGIVAESQQPTQFAPVLGLTITGNQITANYYGIYLVGTRGTISSNAINIVGPILLDDYGIDDLAPSTSVSRNTISVLTGYGIRIGAANATVTENKIFTSIGGQFGPGIDMGCFDGNVTGNILMGNDGIIHMPNGYTGKNTFYASRYFSNGFKGEGC
jgi:parallel beta-helix repeat protein